MEIDFEHLQTQDFSAEFNAIFITGDHFHEASASKFVPVYENSQIPFYFIGNTKGHLPFTIGELSFEDVPDFEDGMYITGIFHKKNKTWGYGLYNDEENETNIKAAYSRVFKDISSINQG